MTPPARRWNNLLQQAITFQYGTIPLCRISFNTSGGGSFGGFVGSEGAGAAACAAFPAAPPEPVLPICLLSVELVSFASSADTDAAAGAFSGCDAGYAGFSRAGGNSYFPTSGEGGCTASVPASGAVAAGFGRGLPSDRIITANKTHTDIIIAICVFVIFTVPSMPSVRNL